MLPFTERLKIELQHIGKYKAQKYVLDLSKRLNIPVIFENKYNFVTKIGGSSFEETVKETKMEGRPRYLQRLYDNRDLFLKPSISIDINCQNINGSFMEITSKVNGFESKCKGSGSVRCMQEDITSDILWYRKAMCDKKLSTNIDIFYRFYRAYLYSCIAIVDCFLNLYFNWIQQYTDKDHITKIKSTSHGLYIPLSSSNKHYKVIAQNSQLALKNLLCSEPQDLIVILPIIDIEKCKELQKITSIENKIKVWQELFTLTYNYKKSPFWSCFTEIKNQRNLISHPRPTISYNLKTIVTHLNYCRTIGDLLAEFRRCSTFCPNIGFIRQLQTAPKITVK